MASVKEYVQSVVNAIGEVNTTLTQINAQDVPNKIRDLKVEVGSKQLLGTYDGSAVEVTEAGVVDIGAMLDEGKLPLEVNVNVASGGEDDPIQNIINRSKSLKGWFSRFQGETLDIDISKYDLSPVTDYDNAFYNCVNLTTLPLLDMPNNTTLNKAFYICRKLKEIHLSNTGNVINMAQAFGYLDSVETIEVVDMNKVTASYGVSSMFSMGCKLLTNLTLLNIRVSLFIGSGTGEKSTDFGFSLTLDSLINTCKELINVGSAKTLTMGTANLNKIANTYVKFVDSTQTEIAVDTKGDVVVCESTDEGAMLLSDYALLKNWTLA